ncbi:MAG: hypothetical protein U0326_27180 [Polyangiales bacterium]
MLGFDRKVRLRWLDLVAERILLGDNLPTLRDRLRRTLSVELKDNGSGGALGKTMTVLLRVWANPTPGLRAFREEALRLYRETPSDQTLWLHWGMVLATHPFMCELATHAGRLLALQDDVSLSEVHLRMVERWGDRSTLRRAVQRAMWSLTEWQVLRETGALSIYGATSRRRAPSDAVQVWMIEALLRAQNTPCMSLRQVETSPALFPFDMRLVVSEMRKSPRIELSRQGVDVDMVALRDAI